MDKNLTVQEALTELLAEKKSLLNDSKTLVAALKEHVSPAHSNKVALFRKALLETNIGEALMVADGLSRDVRAKAEAEAVARLQEVHMTKKKCPVCRANVDGSNGPEPGADGRQSCPRT